MQKKSLIENIEGFGFAHNEALVYLAALECGTSACSVLAKSAGLNRITAYTAAQKCLKKGILSISEFKGVSHFTAVDPQIFFEDQAEKVEKLKSSLDDLQNLSKGVEQKPHVQFFEGISGLKHAYAQTLMAETEILSIANSQNIREFWPAYDREYVQKRSEKNIFLRGIAPDNKEGRLVQLEDEKYKRQTKLIDQDLFPQQKIENEISIFDDHVLIASFESDPFAILMDSHTVAQTQRQMFLLLWNMGK